jgi:magnesium-transporting ATPase (P-type)
MIKGRSLVFQVVVWVLTFGLYGFYWYYSTLEEMTKFNSQRTNSLVWTILMVVPFLNLWAMWKHASAADKAFEKEYPAVLLWLLWIFIQPAVWILVQLELNRIAGTPLPDSNLAA